MANLIQSKQIEGIVTASVIEGNFTVSGQIIATGSESIFGAISSSGPIYGVRYDDIQGTPSFVGGTGISITQVGDVITITNTGDGGVVSGSAELISSVAQLNSYTGSNDILIVGLQSQIASLIASTSSYETKGRGIISGSDQLTSSFDSRYVLSGSIGGGGTSDFTQLTNVPSGLVSSSEQILGGTDILSGSHTDISSLNEFTSSYFTDSASFDSRINSISVSGVPSGTISSSQQIQDLGFVTSSEETPFNGDRVVSNTLLGDLYSESYNAGTSGSLREFIEQVFFPSSAPTATFTTQTANLNTNLATDGTNLESISITDTVDDSPYVVTLGGANASSLTPVPTNADSSSWELRANGDLTAGTYTYDVTVTDSTTATRTYSGRTLTIAQANNGTMSVNGPLYIIESATSGVITLSSTGRPGSTGVVSVSYSPNYGSQVATNFTSSNSLISINSSNGQLSVGSPISGSGNLSGDTITSTISWEDQYGNTDSDTISVNVTTNFAPTHSTTVTTNNNTNQATGSTQIIRLTVIDTEGDSIPNSGLVWGDYNSTYFTATVSSPYMYLNVNNTSIPAGIYPYTASFSDVHGFRTSSYSSSVTINQADDGTLDGDINNYIIESAVTNDVLRDATGFNNGNASQVSVSYSPNYGSQIVQLFTSSNPSVQIDSSGYLTLGVDLSGSVTQSNDTFTSTITWEDQYGNTDSRTINVTVFGNQSPSVSFTDLGLNTDTAVSGAHIGTLTISDTEGNTPFSASIGGTDGSKFEIVPQNANSSSYYVYPTGSLTLGDYVVQFVVTDNYSETATLNETISVSSAILTDTIYVYTLPIDGTYNNVTGITSVGSGTPPAPTISTEFGFFTSFVNNDTLGDSTLTVAYGGSQTATLRGSAAGSNLDDILDGLGVITIGGSPASERIFIMIPSGSNLTGVPTSLSNVDPGSNSNSGEYVVFVSPNGTYQDSSDALGNDIKFANIHKLTLDTAVNGYSDWIVIGTADRFQNTNAYVRIVPSSGSVPS
jgi:hypothetical protein